MKSKAARERYIEKRRVYFICAQCDERKPCNKENLHPGKVCRSCKQRARFSVSGPASVGARAWPEQAISQYGFDRYGNHWTGTKYRKGQRTLALERDAYKCRVPQCQHFSRHLEVHHIVAFKKSQSHRVENLITLCRYHHTEVERFIDITGALPFVWPLLHWNPDEPWEWPPPIDPDIPPF